MFKVADKANANRTLVEPIAFEVAAEELLAPAWADLDLPITRVDAVADDEVVGQSIFHAAASVAGIVLGSVAEFDCAVVDDDGIPEGWSHGDAGVLCPYVAKLIGAGGWIA